MEVGRIMIASYVIYDFIWINYLGVSVQTDIAELKKSVPHIVVGLYNNLIMVTKLYHNIKF